MIRIPVVKDIMTDFCIDAIYIAMSINVLTHYNRVSKTCTLMYKTSIELAFHLIRSIRATMSELHSLYPDLPIIVNSLYGMDLSGYHNRGCYSLSEQQALDNAIDLVNTEIVVNTICV